MTTKQHILDGHIKDRENLLPKASKNVNGMIRPVLSSRPALGEVGNKITTHDKNTGIPKLSTTVVHPKAALKIVKVSKTNKVLSVSEKENTVITKKTEKSILTTKTFIKRQDTIAKPLPVKEKIKPEEIKSYSSKQIAIIDPDVSQKDQPQMVVEYLSDIFSYLRELEGMYPIKEKFLESHHVTPRMRGILINWMVEVHANFKLCLETLHMGVALVDRYLQDNRHVGRETLQLVGTSAMLVASKYEEMYIPAISDFVYICDNIFSTKQILQMEMDILKKLNFNLGRPLSIHFLRRYSKVGQVTPEQHNLAKYILELALVEYETCHIKPSIQAAAASCLSVAVLEAVTDPSKVWTPTLVHYTTYKYSDFKQVIIAFAHLIKKAETSKNQAVRKKYSEAACGKISLDMKLKGSLIRRLTLIFTPPK